MAWQDKLTDEEREELRGAQEARDTARNVHNAIRRKLKSKAEYRERKEAQDAEQTG